MVVRTLDQAGYQSRSRVSLGVVLGEVDLLGEASADALLQVL